MPMQTARRPRPAQQVRPGSRPSITRASAAGSQQRARIERRPWKRSAFNFRPQATTGTRLNEDPIVKTPDEEARLVAFRRRASEAQPGWLPPVEEREEINADVLHKSLGIEPEQTYPGRMSAEQRLEIITKWFAGTEAEIPYEDWGLERPSWIPKP